MSGVEIISWPMLKGIIDSAPVDFSYLPTTNFYYIYTSGLVTLACTITRDGSAEVSDFESNYRSRAVDFFYKDINQFANLTGNGTTTIKTGPGLLKTLTINNNSTGGVVVIYDNISASGTKIMTIQLGTPLDGLNGLPGPVNLSLLDVRFNLGLTIETSGSSTNDITVFYK